MKYSYDILGEECLNRKQSFYQSRVSMAVRTPKQENQEQRDAHKWNAPLFGKLLKLFDLRWICLNHVLL